MPDENNITSYPAHDNTKHSIKDELVKLIVARGGNAAGVKNIADAVKVLTGLEEQSNDDGNDNGNDDGNDNGNDNGGT